ncbi:MAG: NOL1/NOP2/sun family putative RNA methylase [Anaerolineales bacterium]|nr:NOL1/NOP2/sun family putative RNA methylase [Anaerolineales bacterium]
MNNYQSWLSWDEQAQLTEALQRPLPASLRLNTLKITPDIARQRWGYGWHIEPIPFCEAGWQLTAYDMPPSRTLEYRMGYYYIQDAASMLPAEVFSPHRAPLILDLAAAPGGKTTHLVDRFHDQGFIVANDSSTKRITALRSNLQTWGATGIMLTNYSGERFGTWFPETFDKVLLDAPCSGDTLREDKGRKKREVSAKEQSALAERQLALAISAFRALKVGGELVYATCTLNPTEDEGVLDTLLKTYPNAAIVETIDHLPIQAPALAIEGHHPSVRHALRLWPYLYHTSGFFTARIRKTDQVPSHYEPPPYQEPDWQPLKQADQWQDELAQRYGFTQALPTLWQKGELIYAIPSELSEELMDVPNMGMGLLVGQMQDGQIIPSHELITRYERQFTEGRLTISEADCQIWLEGRDLRQTVDAPSGAVMLLEDEQGRFVGRGKVLRDRIRNLLPKRVT